MPSTRSKWIAVVMYGAMSLLCLQWALPCQAAVHKCVVKGVVHYQQAPCISAEPRRESTLAELNEAQKRLPSPVKAPVRAQQAAAADTVPAAPGATTRADLPVGQAAPAYRCDGRKRCSQMTSCAEAKFFLANCPTVEMDGDHDGIPCERQWCQP